MRVPSLPPPAAGIAPAGFAGASSRPDPVRWLFRLPARGALLAIRLYQRTLSPALPALFGPACGCRFAPTCSHYAADAIRVHGVLVGVGLAAIRLLKCTPLHPGGLDPVPEENLWRAARRALPFQPRHRPVCQPVVRRIA